MKLLVPWMLLLVETVISLGSQSFVLAESVSKVNGLRGDDRNAKEQLDIATIEESFNQGRNLESVVENPKLTETCGSGFRILLMLESTASIGLANEPIVRNAIIAFINALKDTRIEIGFMFFDSIASIVEFPVFVDDTTFERTYFLEFNDDTAQQMEQYIQLFYIVGEDISSSWSNAFRNVDIYNSEPGGPTDLIIFVAFDNDGEDPIVASFTTNEIKMQGTRILAVNIAGSKFDISPIFVTDGASSDVVDEASGDIFSLMETDILLTESVETLEDSFNTIASSLCPPEPSLSPSVSHDPSMTPSNIASSTPSVSKEPSSSPSVASGSEKKSGKKDKKSGKKDEKSGKKDKKSGKKDEKSGKKDEKSGKKDKKSGKNKSKNVS